MLCGSISVRLRVSTASVQVITPAKLPGVEAALGPPTLPAVSIIESSIEATVLHHGSNDFNWLLI